MTHAAQLGRLIEREIYNLGFCGKAFMETVVAEALGRIDTPLYIVDVIPNNSPEQLAERMPGFLDILCAARPTTPVLLVEDRQFGGASFVKGRSETRRHGNTVLAKVVADARRRGLQNLHVAGGVDWYGEDGEGTIDGSHPNDLGAHRMAHRLKPFVDAVLRRPEIL